MKIAIGSDHAGVDIKKGLISELSQLGPELIDLGTDKKDSCDYPDFAIKVAENVRAGKSDFGILICTTGLGMCIAANKVKKIRAVLLSNRKQAKLSRAHNNANVLCFSSQMKLNKIMNLIKVYLNTEFEEGRHLRRINKIADYENGKQ